MRPLPSRAPPRGSSRWAASACNAIPPFTAPTTRRARPTSDRSHAMGRSRPLLFLAGFVLLALASGTAWAQTEILGYKLDGSVELGGRAYIDRPTDKQSGKFEEYRDIPQGIFLEDLRLRLSTKDDRYLFEFKATEAGRS